MSAERPSARRRREAGPGWLATAAGALLLVVVGFAFGLLAGAAFEEPELVAGHLAGRTTEVPVGETPPGAEPAAGPLAAAPPPAPEPAPPAEEASRPLGAPREAEAPAEPVARAPAPPASPPTRPAAPASPPPVASPPPSAAPAAADGFAIQVGAFAERDAAEALARELRALELPVYVVAEERGHARFKVRVGPFAARHEAERHAARLKSERRLPTWILSRGGG